MNSDNVITVCVTVVFCAAIAFCAHACSSETGRERARDQLESGTQRARIAAGGDWIREDCIRRAK
jgi:hypothetical protein